MAYTPKSNRRFWAVKFASNVRRDRLQSARLRRAGWRVLTVWECRLTKSVLDGLVRRIRNA